jgi:hypothetical protein
VEAVEAAEAAEAAEAEMESGNAGKAEEESLMPRHIEMVPLHVMVHNSDERS